MFRSSKILMMVLLLLTFSVSALAAENKVVLQKPADTKTDGEQVEQITLVTQDLLIATALKSYKMAIFPLQEKRDKLEREIIEKSFAALYKRWQTWKLAEGQFTDAFVDVLVNFAAMQRFFTPDKEFNLTFEKSVHTRINYFYRMVASGQFADKAELFDFPTDPQSLDYAKLYHRIYDFKTDSSEGQLAIMIWLHLLRTEPELQNLWEQYQRLDGVLAFDTEQIWDKIGKAAKGVALARLQDLEKPLNRVKIFNTLMEDQSLNLKSVTVFNRLDEQLLRVVEILESNDVLVNAENLLAVMSTDPQKKLRLMAIMKNTVDFEKFQNWLKTCRIKNATNLDFALLSEDPSTYKKFAGRNPGLWVMNGNRIKRPEITPMIQMFFADNSRVELASEAYKRYAEYFERLAQKFGNNENSYAAQLKVIRLWRDIFKELAALESEQDKSPVKFARLPESISNNQDLMRMYFSKPEYQRILSIKPDTKGKPGRVYLGHMFWKTQTIKIEMTTSENGITSGNSDQLPLVPIKTEDDTEPLTVSRKIKFNALRLGYSEGISEFSLDFEEMLKKVEYFEPAFITHAE